MKKKMLQLIILSSAALLSALLLGCEQPLQEGQTYHRVSNAWPLWDQEKWEGENPDGTTWTREKGDACCWLSTWDKERRYDARGMLIYKKEKSGFFPLYSHMIEESDEFRLKEGNVLIFPYRSYRRKTAGD